MGESTKNIMLFAIGAGIGSLVTYFAVKAKYDKLIDEEIESVKAAYRGTDILAEAENEPEEEKKTDYIPKADRFSTEDYNNYAEIANDYKTDKKGGEEVKNNVDRPYVISPDEFGEIPDYAEVSLTMYSDGVITDDCDEVLSEEEIDDAVGMNSLNHFGEYEEDSVFVRNDRMMCDYEILKDYRTYDEVFPDHPTED